MKVLGVVREVKEEYCVVSLPTMLAGFVRREEVSDRCVFWVDVCHCIVEHKYSSCVQLA